MNVEELIEHILGNSNAYIKAYKTKEKLNDYEKGILEGLYYDVESIKNHLEMEKIDIDDKNEMKKIEELETKLNLENILHQLKDIIDEK